MICVGGDEPEGWIEQSRSYFELCDSQNIKVDFKIVEGTNHFSLLDHAMSEDYELNKKIIEFIENQQRRIQLISAPVLKIHGLIFESLSKTSYGE